MNSFEVERPSEHSVIRADGPRSTHRPDLSAGLAKYFAHATARLNYLEYGDPSDFLIHFRSAAFSRTPLAKVWVPPRFKRQFASGEEVQLATFLGDNNACLLVLADPGFGKSTLARYLSCLFIDGYRSGEFERFGIYVPLSILRTKDMSHHDAVALCAATYVNLQDDTDVIQALKDNLPHARIVFDGLDELPSLRRGNVGDSSLPVRSDAKELITALRHRHPVTGGWVEAIPSIVTCRLTDYFEDTASTLDVPHYVLSRFSPPQRNQAVRMWHEAALLRLNEQLPEDSTATTLLTERGQAILSALRDHADLGELCLTPLMLSILQTVFAGQWDLPASVSQLCSRAVSWMLIDKRPGPNFSSLLQDYAPWLLEIVTELAWQLHTNYVANGPKGFDADELRGIANKVSPLTAAASSRTDAYEDAVTSVCSFIRRGHGIFIRLSGGQYDFAHNMLREVMAGRALGRLQVPQMRTFALNELWAGPIRYWAGIRAAEKRGAYEISAFIDELKPDVEAGSLTATLARAEMLVEVCLVRARADFHQRLLDLVPEVRGELIESLSRTDLHRAVRIRIGDLLAVLGDPTLELGWIEKVQWIETGEYVIGSKENHPTKLEKYASCPSAPTCRGKLERFGIGRHLVTNSEYAKFIEAGGYHARRYWPSTDAWSWASGEQKIRNKLIADAQSVAPTHFSSEFASQRLVADEIPDRCTQMIDRTQPLYWVDPSFNRPNQPVVGVNWWEAMAYCAWLSEELRAQGLIQANETVRLPIEAEWETAARLCGDGIYPWSSGLPTDCAHLRELESDNGATPLFRSCAVGLFRATPASLPIFDLTGNVWEWTGSLALPYSIESFKASIEGDGMRDRIARGSSWLSREGEAAKVTFRSFDPPFNAYDDLGFRVAVGPIFK